MPRKETLKARLDRARSRCTVLEAKKRTVEGELKVAEEEYTRLARMWQENGEADTLLSVTLAFMFYRCHTIPTTYASLISEHVRQEATRFLAALRELGWNAAIKRRDSDLRESINDAEDIRHWGNNWCVARIRPSRAWHAHRKWRYVVRCALLGGWRGGLTRIDPHTDHSDTIPVRVALPIPDWCGPLGELAGQHDLVRLSDANDIVIHCCPRCKTPVTWNLSKHDEPDRHVPLMCATCMPHYTE